MPGAARLSILALAVALATLAPKLAAGSTYAVPDHEGLYRQTEGRLQAAGYETEIVPHAFLTHVLATRGQCRALVAELKPNGTTLARLDLQAKGIGAGQVVYRGQYRAGIPPFLPTVMDRVQREMARLGVALTRAPVIYLAQTADCEIDPAILAGLDIGTVLREQKQAAQ